MALKEILLTPSGKLVEELNGCLEFEKTLRIYDQFC